MLEDKLAALIVALEANTAAMDRSIEARVEATALVRTLARDAAGQKDDAAEVIDAKPEPVKKEKAPAPAPAPVKEEQAPAPSTDEDPYAGLRELVAEYLGVERPEERKARQDKVRLLLDHPAIRDKSVPAGSPTDLRNIAVSEIPRFKNQMRLLAEKGDLTTPAPAEEDALV